MKHLKLILILILPFTLLTTANAQLGCAYNNVTEEWEAADGGPCQNSIIAAVPFLKIAVDARSAGMGETGIAVSSDVNALQFNESKLAFSTKKRGYAFSVRPMGNTSAKLFYLSGYEKISEKGAIGVGLRYFSLGKVQWTDSNGQTFTNRSQEFEMELAYARQLSKNFSVAVAGKYILSDLSASGLEGTGGSLALDASFTAKDLKIRLFDNETVLNLGLALTNVGQKISYTNGVHKDYIPTNLGLGAAWNVFENKNHLITCAFDMNKLLVPTPSINDEDSNGIPDYRQKTTIGGIFSSFSDAPGGAKEELREVMYSVGVEYWLKQKWAVRGGYFSQHETKGDRQYFSVGVGARIKGVGLDFSFEIPQDSYTNIDNTMRLTAMYNFDSKKIRAGK